MSRISLWLSAFLCLLVGLRYTAADVSKVCRQSLTQFDPHLDAYVGQVFEIDEAVHVDTQESYKYKIGVCTSIENASPPDCAVLQTRLDDTHAICVGQQQKAQVSRTTDGVWIELTYPDGKPYHGHCGGAARTTRLIFLCDPLVPGLGKFDFLNENRNDSVCFYTFTVAAKAVCGYTLSPGDIILILFACLVIMWLVAMIGACLFKRIIQGAKGLEQIPLIDWYKEFGNLEADGCDLVCRSRKRVVKEYREPTFGADTDDEDDDKDDNLLPM